MIQYDHTQEAWDEYMSTGIAPTGGELGPDFDPDTGRPLDEYQEDEPEQWQEEAEADYYEEEKPSRSDSPWRAISSLASASSVIPETTKYGLKAQRKCSTTCTNGRSTCPTASM